MSRAHRRWAAAALLLACSMIMVSACGAADTSSSDSVKNSRSQTSSSSGAKIADSLPGLIDYWLDDGTLDPPVSAEQRKVLEKAKQEGTLNAADYEHSWSQYKQCMADKGYPGIIAKRYANGVQIEASHVSMPGEEAQDRKYSKDRNSCYNTYLLYVQDVYSRQQGNAHFYSDTAEGLVDCLKRHRLVPNDYTAEQFKTEWPDDVSYNENDPEARACEVANFYFKSYEDEPTEDLW